MNTVKQHFIESVFSGLRDFLKTGGVHVIILTLSLIWFLYPGVSVEASWRGRTIVIWPDGSVYPNDAPVKRDGETYFLMDDVEVTSGGGIIILRDNIVVDGGNHVLRGDGWDSGVILIESKGVMVRNMKIENFEKGIYLESSFNNKIIGNDIEKNELYGIDLYESFNNEIIGNEFVGCGLYVFNSHGNIVKDNIVNGKPLIFLENESNKRITDAGQVILVRCSNITVENLSLANASIGIELLKTSNSVIQNNNIKNNWKGIMLYYSSDNKIVGNNLDNNLLYGVYLYKSSNNSIYHNNFIKNRRQAFIFKSTNAWDDGSMGNYWSSYWGRDWNGDGIGDEPYDIDENNRDSHPLMRPFKAFLIDICTQYGVATGSGLYKPGMVATVSISQTIINHVNGTRRIFKGWFENNVLLSSEQSFMLTVDGPRVIVAGWEKEYEVKVLSERGTIAGSGWYRLGATVVVSISPAQAESFFNNYVFEGWVVEGNMVSNSPTYSFTLDRPITLVASWRTEPNAASISAIVVAVLAIVLTVLAVLQLRIRVRAAQDVFLLL